MRSTPTLPPPKIWNVHLVGGLLLSRRLESVRVQVFSVSLQGCIFLPGKELYKYGLFHKAWFIFKLLSFLHWLLRLDIDVTVNCYSRN